MNVVTIVAQTFVARIAGVTTTLQSLAMYGRAVVQRNVNELLVATQTT